MSARDLCSACSAQRRTESVDQLIAGEGPYFEQWKLGVVSYAERLIRS